MIGMIGLDPIPKGVNGIYGSCQPTDRDLAFILPSFKNRKVQRASVMPYNK